jgi:hypothetical protein
MPEKNEATKGAGGPNREQRAQKRGGNPDKPRSANAGNVSVGGIEPQQDAPKARAASK